MDAIVWLAVRAPHARRKFDAIAIALNQQKGVSLNQQKGVSLNQQKGPLMQ
jgi:hypothetical protein